MNRKMAAMFATMMVALSLVGVAYAMWSETLTLKGTVNTGTVDVEWSLKDWGDTETKDVSGVTARIEGSILYIEITNAYPCVTYWVDFDVHCVGTVPVHILVREMTEMPGLKITLYGEPPYQIHTCEEILGRVEFHFTNLDPYEQGSTYYFTVELLAHQYNESP